MKKEEARKLYIEKRKELSFQEIELLSDKILHNFTTFFKPKFNTIHIFLSIQKYNEVDTINFRLDNNQIVTSKSDFKTNTLSHYKLDENTKIIVSNYGIPEPQNGIEFNEISSIDYLIIPLLCYDKKGYRVGYGKGFYDKFLSSCDSKAKKIGVSFFTPIECIQDVDDFDVKLDYCITPNQLFIFNK